MIQIIGGIALLTGIGVYFRHLIMVDRKKGEDSIKHAQELVDVFQISQSTQFPKRGEHDINRPYISGIRNGRELSVFYYYGPGEKENVRISLAINRCELSNFLVLLTKGKISNKTLRSLASRGIQGFEIDLIRRFKVWTSDAKLVNSLFPANSISWVDQIWSQFPDQSRMKISNESVQFFGKFSLHKSGKIPGAVRLVNYLEKIVIKIEEGEYHSDGESERF